METGSGNGNGKREARRTLRALAAGARLPFKFEAGSPDRRPIAAGLRSAVATLRARGRLPVYTLRLVHGFFVYYVQVS